MDRRALLDAALQHLHRAVILLTAAGEDRLALDVEELAEWLEFAKPPPEDTPRQEH